ncbi:MAG: T9SS type A sorting domain-containing protein [Ignavibacteriae bacterium]|nr:T9SS type A sorting domain-containing protein [Ignavibacteriota bacterium]MCB9215129.1 T9SS type A sorting domain-containing protein [Ignavibacteria bacterium]
MKHRIILFAGLFSLTSLSLSLFAQSSRSDIEWITWNNGVYHSEIAISPDSKRIATTVFGLSLNATGQEVRVYSAEEGELDRGGTLEQVIEAPTFKHANNPYAYTSYYRSFGFLSDASLFVSCGNFDSVINRAVIYLVNVDIQSGRSDLFRAVTSSFDPKYSAGLYASVRSDSIYGVKMYENRDFAFAHPYPTTSATPTLIAISTDGSVLALQANSQYMLVNAETREVLGSQDYVGDWQFAYVVGDNRSIAFLGDDHVLKVLNIETGELERRIVSSDLSIPDRISVRCAISPDKNYFAISRPDGTIHVWNLQTGQKLHVYDEYLGVHTALSFTPDNKHLISLTKDGAVISWKSPSRLSGVDERTKYDRYSTTLSSTSTFNSTSHTARFTFTLPERSEVHVGIYNLQGELVGELTEPTLEGGEHSVEWHRSDLPSGAYFYRLSAGSRVGTGRLVVQ